jgi:colanic acid biosynthesis glycosyl transferase WcaI
MKVLLISSNYWPEPTGIAVYTTDIARVLQSSGSEVTVLTGLPHYPWWSIPEEFGSIRDGVSIQDVGIRLVRTKHFIPKNVHVINRMRFEWSLFWRMWRSIAPFKSSEFDVVISVVPTVASGLVGKLFAKRSHVPFGLIVQDLSGNGSRQSGLRGGNAISKIVDILEGAALKSADGIVVVSPAMKSVLVANGIQASSIATILNYSAKRFSPVVRDQAKAHFGWERDEFLVLHSGNMGAKQDLENVLRAAKWLQSDTKIKIVFVGHGNQESRLKELAVGQSNVEFRAAVSDEEYSTLLSAADLLLVNERATQLDMSLPSKLTSYLQSGTPVIAASPRGGATWALLEDVAELVEAGNPKELATRITWLSENPLHREKLANQGLTFAQQNFDPEVGREKYVKWVGSISWDGKK